MRLYKSLWAKLFHVIGFKLWILRVQRVLYSLTFWYFWNIPEEAVLYKCFRGYLCYYSIPLQCCVLPHFRKWFSLSKNKQKPFILTSFLLWFILLMPAILYFKRNIFIPKNVQNILPKFAVNVKLRILRGKIFIGYVGKIYLFLFSKFRNDGRSNFSVRNISVTIWYTYFKYII